MRLFSLFLVLLLNACVSDNNLTPEKKRELFNTRLQLSSMYFQEGRIDYALEESLKALKLNSKNSDIHSLLGWIYLTKENNIKANKHFKQSLSLNRNSDTLYNYAWSLCQNKKYNESHKIFDSALKDNQINNNLKFKILLAKGICYFDNNNLKESEIFLNQSQEYSPNNPTIIYYLSSILYKNKDFKKASINMQAINSGNNFSAQTLWLGIKIERQLNNNSMVDFLVQRLRDSFNNSKELLWYDQGRFNE